MQMNSAQSDDLLRRGLLLEYTTLAWNVVGTVVVVAAAIKAHSVALAGFGLDSLIEIFASMIVVWQLKGTHQRRERTALRCIAGAFAALAIYVLAQSAYTLATGARPAPLTAAVAFKRRGAETKLVLPGLAQQNRSSRCDPALPLLRFAARRERGRDDPRASSSQV
jgi:hypothetical protein